MENTETFERREIQIFAVFCFQKCVLYWPEKRGIYGKVEVLVIGVNECDNYTIRNLVLKVRS